jgi:diguanylate cyclase (GGDEF)-like protein
MEKLKIALDPKITKRQPAFLSIRQLMSNYRRSLREKELELKQRDEALRLRELKVSELEAQVCVLERKAYIDPLTTLYNKAALDEELKVEKNFRFGGFMDIDNLKSLNDKLGHVRANYVIQELARVLADNIRMPFDRAFRFGGDEFFYTINYLPKPGESEDAIYQKINIIRDRLEQIFAKGIPVNLPDGLTVIATATIGEIVSIQSFEEIEDNMNIASMDMLNRKSIKKIGTENKQVS